MPHLQKYAASALILASLAGCSLFSAEPLPPIQTVNAVPQSASWTKGWWKQRHAEKIQQANSAKVDLLMLGDSITHAWETTGAATWEKYYGQRNAFNLGFSGDRTEHVLWRLQNGAVDNLAPKLTVLMIGTNNTGYRMDPAGHTAKGIEAIVAEIRTRLPESKILILGIFPRHHSPHNEMRQRNDAINRQLARLENEPRVFFLDINDAFLDEQHNLRSELMPDLLHPSEAGYEAWARAMEPAIRRLMY